MRHTKITSMLLMGLLIVSLVSTSLGGAFATAALAATPEETAQDNNQISKPDNMVVGGLLAVGLLVALAGHGHDGNVVSPAKNSTGDSTSLPATNAPVLSQPQTQQQTQSQTVPSTGITAEEQRAFDLLNADRVANGLRPLKLNLALSSLGENYAQDMINRGFFAHNNPEGQSPFDRMQQAGISYRYAGENLAINRDVNAAEQAFMNSPGHRANILSPNYTEVGLGVRESSSGSVYVAQEFISH